MADVILVVAGDPIFAKGVERAFSDAGLEVVLADEAETAMVALEFEKPAAVIVENDLRDKPGSQLARDIRSKEEGTGIPLVLLAGAMMPAAELAPRVFSAGVTACLDSNVDLGQLARALKMRLAGDADALGRLARGEFIDTGEEPTADPAENASVEEGARAEASIPEAAAASGAVEVEVDSSAFEPEPEAAPVAEEYPPAKPRSGSLGDLPFGELLAELHADHATGVLDLSREKVKKSIWLAAGVPTYAKSNAMGETLGAVLVKMGKITEAQRLTSMEAMQKQKRKHGDVLVEMGIIKPKDVATALQAQARAKVINCFAWDDGVYRFVPEDELPDDMPSLKMSFGALIHAGVKQRYDLPRLRKALLPHIGETPRFQDSRASILEEMKLEPHEREVVAAMRGRRSLAEVLALSDLDEEELHRLIVMASFSGVIKFYPEGPVTMQMRLGRDGEEVSVPAALKPRATPPPEPKRPDPPKKPAPPAVIATPPPPPAVIATPPPAPRGPTLGSEEADEPTELDDAADAEPPSGDDLVSAEDLLKDIDTASPKKPPARPEPSTPKPAARPPAVIATAPAPAPVRTAPVKERSRDPEPTAPPRADPAILDRIQAALTKMQTQNYYDRLEVATGAPEGSIKSSYLRLAKEYHPDKLVQEGGSGVKEKADQLFALVSEAYHTLTDTTKRKKYDDEVLHGKMTDDAASEEAEAILNAEHQFLKGERLLKSGSLQKAFDCFQEAVDLYPKEAEYQAAYGFTMFRINHPGTPSRAAEGEKIVKTAVGMNPRNDKIQYFLGVIAKAKNDNDVARKFFETALDLNPDNAEAKSEIRVMDMRDSKGKGLSGLFSRKK